MCGIVGINNTEFLNFDDILSTISKRGPDNLGSFTVPNKATFGHSRLNIINDEKNSNQPMVFDDILIVFNGEIYNYKKLILDNNLDCLTSSDTEVLIRLYQRYGVEFLDKLNGAFSFCIYDIKNDLYFCARDRYGKKPFYYYFKDDKFILSSMIKPIIKLLGDTPKMNKVALAQYLQYFVPLAPNTFYQAIYKLDNATYIIVKNNKLISKKYYTINTKKKIFDEEIALDKCESILQGSVEKRINTAVDVGALLSGGVDSSLLCAMASKITNKKLQTFSVGYDGYKKYNELPFAKTVSTHINSTHHELSIKKEEYLFALDGMLEDLEEPHADPSSTALYLLSKYIKNNSSIKTVLSGEGSDELFLGYNQYDKYLKYYEFKKSLSIQQHQFLDDIIVSLGTNTKEAEHLRRVVKNENIYNSFGEIFTPRQLKKLLIKVPTSPSLKVKDDCVDWMSYVDTTIWLGQGLLSKVDKMTMSYGIETRNPFLDYELVNTAFSIDNKIKLGNTNKYIIKKIASKYLPSSIVNRVKKGFNTPYHEWLFEEFGEDILKLILKVNKNTGFFNEEYLKQIYNLALENKYKQHLYSLWLWSLWYEKTYM